MSNKSGNEQWNNISESDLIQNFPLHRACRDGDVSLLTNLLQQKGSANVHLRLEDTYYGWTPLHWAAYFGKPECLRVLAQSSSSGTVDWKTSRYNQTPAHIAAFAGHPLCLQWLIQLGASVNAKDYLGETPLHKAARSGSEECVNILVKTKALIGVKNESGKTPADLSAINGSPSVTNYLLNLQKQEEAARPLISSNGYYGYQPINGSLPKSKTNCECDASMEMDTEEAPIPMAHSNGTTNGVLNGHNFTNATPTIPPLTVTGLNGHSNNFQPFLNGFQNGVIDGRSAAKDTKGDITLNEDISRNRVPVAGKKRSREEAVYMPQVKRIRTEGSSFASPLCLPLYTSNQRVPFSNISNWESCEGSLKTIVQGKLNVDQAKNKSIVGVSNESISWQENRFNFTHRLLQPLSSSKYCKNAVEEVVFISTAIENRNEDEIKRESTCRLEDEYNLASEILRETHGCEAYLLHREAI